MCDLHSIRRPSGRRGFYGMSAGCVALSAVGRLLIFSLVEVVWFPIFFCEKGADGGNGNAAGNVPKHVLGGGENGGSD